MPHQPLHLFAPRVGFAYDLFGNGRMVIRGGYGIYYQGLSGMGMLQTFVPASWAQGGSLKILAEDRKS